MLIRLATFNSRYRHTDRTTTTANQLAKCGQNGQSNNEHGVVGEKKQTLEGTVKVAVAEEDRAPESWKDNINEWTGQSL